MNNTASHAIRTLSQSMINKIAAGEVIERPASVIKELVENSIDAGSTRIDVAVEEGGANLIRVVDNGYGIASDQLLLAVSPHATSKISGTDDLFQIRTFGFRGEALASMAEISQMSIKSRPVGSNEGAEIKIHGGERNAITACGMPTGSQIEVRNLFFNTPVRRKYMKSTTTEFGHVAEAFVRLVLPQPGIHFTLKHNERIVHDLPPEQDPLARVRQIFGEDVTKNMIYVESRPGSPVHVRGHVSHPNQSRNNNRMQYFFLNHRFIRDRSLQHALTEAYRGLLTVGRFPLAFLQIEMPPDMFDVNVHPTKMEVRFLDSNRVYSGFLSAIREKFLSTDLNGTFDPAGLHRAAPNPTPNPMEWTTPSATELNRSASTDFEARNAMPPPDAIDPRTAMADPVQRDLDSASTEKFGQDRADSHDKPAKAVGLSLHSLPSHSLQQASGNVYPGSARSAGLSAPQAPRHFTHGPTEELFEKQNARFDRVATTSSGKMIVQMHESYLILETQTGIAIVDQHALHERILYEQLKERMNTGPLESQRLLVPIPVDLSPSERACVLDNLDFFKTLGLAVEQFGGNTVLISGFPAILSKTPPTEILMSLIEPILESGKKMDRAELLEKLLHSMACKAAVKAGDRINAASMARLIELAEQEANAHHCPHGRPSMLVFSKEELDKMFKRS